jgi:hypothetical protein
MKTSIRRSTGEHYFGIEITPDGKLVVAERMDGMSLPGTWFPAGAPGAAALREHIERESAHPHICIKACGAAALSLATALIPVRGVEVTAAIWQHKDRVNIFRGRFTFFPARITLGAFPYDGDHRVDSCSCCGISPAE